MSQPLVSVIMPNYNHSAYLPARIESILGQTYPNFEVILLDDCSTDNSREVIAKYSSDPRVTNVVINEKNSGSTFVQWQKGFDIAKGEFIWIAESDDMADKNLLTKLVGKLCSVDNGVLAFGHSMMIDQDDKELPYSWDEPKNYDGKGIYDGKSFARHRMVYKNILYNASMIVFRKSCLSGVNPSYREYRYCGDWSFWFDICCQGTVVEVPEKLNYFRQHTNKVSARSRLNGDDFKEQARCQLRIAEVLNLSTYQMKCLRGRSTKRIRKSSVPNKQELIETYPLLYDGTKTDILLYEIDKIIGQSGMK